MCVYNARDHSSSYTKCLREVIKKVYPLTQEIRNFSYHTLTRKMWELQYRKMINTTILHDMLPNLKMILGKLVYTICHFSFKDSKTLDKSKMEARVFKLGAITK